MSTKLNKLYLLIPVLYLAVILGLLFLQFFRTNKTVETLGTLSITIESSNSDKKTDGKSHANILATAYGITFPFNQKNPLVLELKDGKLQRLELLDYQLNTDSFTLQFTQNMTLTFQTQKGKDKAVKISLSGQSSEIKAVLLPFKIQKGVYFQKTDEIPLLSLKQNGKKVFFSLPAASQFDLDNQQYRVSVDQQHPAVIHLEPAPSALGNPFLYWFAQGGRVSSSALYEQSLKDFLDKAYSGWTESRYHKDSGKWELPGGELVSKENIVISALSEAVVRSEFREARRLFNKTIRSQEFKARMTYLSTPYLGNMRASIKKAQLEDIKKADIILTLIEKKDPALFRYSGLIQFVEDRGPGDYLINGIIDNANQTDYLKADMAINLGIIDVYIQSIEFNIQNQSLERRFNEIMTEKIFPNLVMTPKGFYLLTQQNKVDMYNTLKLAHLLKKLSPLLDHNKLYSTVSQELLVSALNHADSHGYLPATLTFNSKLDAVQESSVKIAPEDIYLFVAPKKFYPNQFSLSKQLDEPGKWIWSASKAEFKQEGSAQYQILFPFHKGLTQYIMFVGIEKFKKLFLHGIEWRPDPQFDFYSSGWVYDAADKILFLKLTFREDVESVTLAY